MKPVLLIGIIAVLGIRFDASAVQARQDWVTIVIGDVEALGFAPRSEPYTQGGPRVCSEVDEADARTRSGVPIRGFHFIGWKEGDGIRVVALAVVPEAAGAYGLCSEGRGFALLDFGSVHVRVGQEVPFEKMREAGVTPWRIRAGSRAL